MGDKRKSVIRRTGCLSGRGVIDIHVLTRIGNGLMAM